ncbi:sulfite exporter TauE/SafE family protein [Calycomorphotria hydatis]|uniref:Urease accessory protein UreH-like transmembrane domain-containing protein n=1 Tax=Calycomorphotria hydatis TaxID=2528027 RepID=A0A517T3P5_9PLAN|nr:sulfite exporter TauE/SafE family protein [Calycomorphotria hydatis]QDT62995.1 hypothetical protein V22_01930 [Calycomorphotria hydatis]
MLSPLLIATLTASLLGSPHCAGMCGPFVLLAAGNGERTRFLPQLTYHLGRLVSYVLAGVIVGSLGATLDLGGRLVGLQQTAALLAGLGMIVFGVAALLKITGMGVLHFQLPKRFQQFIQQSYARTRDWSPLAKSSTIGLLSTLLPCGWLYVFLLSAAGTGSIQWAMVVMAVFWLGTVPILATLGIGVQSLPSRLRQALPVVTAVFVIVAGAELVSVRAWADYTSLQSEQKSSLEQVEGAGEIPLPCCHGH